MRRFPLVMAVAFAIGLSPLFGQQGGESRPEPPDPSFGFPDDPETAPPPEEPPPRATADASSPDFKAALELQKKGRWAAAQKAFRAMIEKFPTSVHRKAAEERSGDNAFLGIEILHQSGPKERRIDVSVMGDGFTIDPADQTQEQKWAKLCLDVLWNEGAYDEYRDYFNFYFVRLASLEEGVDENLSPEERAKIEERNKSRTNKKKTDFSTALDCKQAGSQKQVMADRRLVYKWLRAAAKDDPGCQDDGLVIAFARFGILGMGGGGIANVGRPDKSVTVHEFGHAFVGLLDEYANNPSAPQSPVKAPNVSMSPDPKEVPWAHFLEKKVPGVGVFLGGATFQKGVWRPAQGCAMNSAGHYGYCPVCRETAVLRIYSYVNPIDSYDPPTSSELSVKEGDDKSFLSVTPMKPKKHELTVTWYVERVATDAPGPQPAASGRTGEDPRERMRRGLSGHWSDGGKRAREERITYDIPPAGEPDNSGVMKKAEGNKPARAAFPIGHLKPGRYRVTGVVQDPSPWVLKDDKHLLEERLSWMVRVLPK